MIPAPEEAESVHVPQELAGPADVGGSPTEGDVLVYQGGQWTSVTPVTQDVVTNLSLSGAERHAPKKASILRFLKGF